MQPTALLGLESFQDQRGNGAVGMNSEALAIGDGLTFGWSLDVDNDGEVTALGDGLMVIRHLFGPSFQGEALINKAISPQSPYLAKGMASAAQAVSDHIQFGIDSGLLDVDRDGYTTAFGDCLMVIRHLLKGPFQGEVLISKAISPQSPMLEGHDLNALSRTQLEDIATQVASTIDTLIGQDF